MALLTRVQVLFRENESLPSASLAEVAVFVDEEAYAALSDTSVSKRVCYDFREVIGVMGAPYDLYLAADAEEVMEKYRAVILLQPCESEWGDRVIDRARESGKALLVVNEKNADMSSAELRALLREAGVLLTCERDAVIYENESYLFLHTAEEGAYCLQKRGARALRDVFTGEEFSDERLCKRGESYLLRRIF